MNRLPQILLAATAVLALSACRDEDRRPTPLASALATVPDLPLAPEGAALVAGPPAPVGRLAPANYNYGWAERAYAVEHAFYGAPPDYGFDYEGVEPWAWETQDDWVMYAEPVSSGYRHYYYEPGEDYPFFVRDPEYGYGYDDGGRLVTVYSTAGVLLAPAYLEERAPLAGRYWSRGMDLRRVGGHAPRRPIREAVWRSREPVYQRSQDLWTRAAYEQPQWREYRRRDDGRDLRRLEPERLRREAVSGRREAWNGGERRADRDGRGDRAPRGYVADGDYWSRDWLRSGDDQARRDEDRAGRGPRSDDRRDRERDQIAAADDRRAWAQAEDRGRREREQGVQVEDRGRRDHERQAQERRNWQEAQDRGRREREQRAQSEDRGRRDHERQAQERRNWQEAQDRGRREREQRAQSEDRGRRDQERQTQDRRNEQEAQDRGRREREQRAQSEDRGRRDQERQAQERRNGQEAQDRGRREREQRAQAEDRGRRDQERQAQERRNGQEAQERGRREREVAQHDGGQGQRDRGGGDGRRERGGGSDQAASAGAAGNDAADRGGGRGRGRDKP